MLNFLYYIVDFRYYEKFGAWGYIKEYKPDVVVCVKDDAHYHRLALLSQDREK